MRRELSFPEYVRWQAYFNMLSQREELQRKVQEARAGRGK